MNAEKLYQLLVWLTVIFAFADVASTFRWMMYMAEGMTNGVPADIAFVLNGLDAILMSYVAYHYVLNRNDPFWGSTSQEGLMIRRLFVAAILLGLFADVFKKAAML